MAWRRWLVVPAVAGGAWLLGACEPEAVLELVVNSTADAVDADPGDGVCETATPGECTLRAAIMEANASAGHDKVVLQAGETYVLSIPPEVDVDYGERGDLDVTESLTITGNGATIDADGIDRVLHHHAGSMLWVYDLTLTGGASTTGAGLLNHAPATLTNVTITANTASGTGGGINNGNNTLLTVTNSTISANQATGGGGGIANNGANAKVENSTITANTTPAGGGGIMNRQGGLLLSIGTTLDHNSAGTVGGGIWNTGNGTIAHAGNTTISANTATTGGGIANAATLDTALVTIADNTATTGSGIAHGTNPATGGTTTLTSSIIATTTGTACDTGITSGGYNLDTDTTCLTAPATGDQPGTDPELGPLADNGGPTHTHLPAATSPAIDTTPPGTTYACDGTLTTDQRQQPRPQGTNCDTGAVEVQPADHEPEPDTDILWAWGDDASSGSATGLGLHITPSPAPVGTDTQWAQVSAGSDFTLAIRTDGTLWAWGSNANGVTGLGTTTGDTIAPSQVGTDTNWAQVSAGRYHSLATRTDGTLWSWGSNAKGQTGLGTTTGNTLAPTQVGTDTNWAQVSAGDSHSLATRTDGTLWSWGSNANGQTGLGTTTGNTLVPTKVGGANVWVAVSAGSSHSLATRTNGTVWAWGDNANGRTGLGTTTGVTSVPTKIGTATGWSRISAGTSHSLAVKTDGTLWAWGNNANGQTGLGTTTGITLVPTQVGTDTNWADADSISAHGVALKSDGTLWTWGLNTVGQTGLGITTDVTLAPTQVGTDTDWAHAGAGSGFTVALKTDGTLWGWGNTRGTGSSPIQDVPAVVGDRWATISAGDDHSLGVKTDGTLWAWGNNENGKTGLGTSSGYTLLPTQIGTDADWVHVSAGLDHSLAIKSDGTLWAWGTNQFGRTGLGTGAGLSTTPVQVGIDIDWASASAGDTHSLATKTDGTLWSFGSNANGRTGLGTTVSSTVNPTQVGTDAGWASAGAGNGFSVAIKFDGTLWSWGTNSNARTGLGLTSGNTLIPAQVGTDADWAQVSAGDNFGLAVKTDGTLWSWGNNNNGRTGLGTALGPTTAPTQVGTDASWARVDAGESHAQALRWDGTLWAWGSNVGGATGLGTTSGDTLTPAQVGDGTDWTRVSAGNQFSLGLRGGQLAPPTPHAFVVNTDVDAVDAAVGDGVCETATPDECSLRAAVMEANATPGHQKIELQPAATYTLSLLGPGAAGGDLELTSHVTIVGNSATIDAAGIDRVLRVDETGHLAANDLTITGGEADAGSGIANAGVVTLTNVTVTTNTATEDGGGIANTGELTITDSSISNNTATEDGGGIANEGDLMITTSDVAANSASSGAGINTRIAATTTLSSVTLTLNVAIDAGGAIANAGDLTINSSTITANTSTGGDGGGIRNDGQASIDGTELSDNTATTGDGAGIANTASLTLTNVTITGNDASAGDGGGVANSGELTIENSDLIGNTAGSHGGGIGNTDAGIVTISGSDLTTNSATGDGGGVANTGTVTIDVSSVTGNVAGGGGGAVHNAGTLAVNSSTLAVNTATGDGGALHNTGAAEISGSIITISTASTGGAISTSGELELTGTDVNDNTAGAGGGIRTVAGGTTTVNVANVVSNQATAGDGGGIANEGTTTVTDSVVAANTANGNGGGIANGGTITIDDSMLASNTSTNGDGGGLHNTSTATVVASTVMDNTATAGDGAGIANDGEATLTNVTVSTNTAGGTGGGVDNDGELTVTYVTIALNTASAGGGLSSSVGATSTVTASVVATNSVDDCDTGVTSGGYNLDSDTSCLTTPVAGDQPGVDPELEPLSAFDTTASGHQLGDTSPARDVVATSTADLCDGTIATDQIGRPRPLDEGCDAGAVETRATMCAFQSDIPASECKALEELFDAANGVSWTDAAGWRVTTTPCSWFGVTCSDGHVTGLDLGSNNLAGHLPSELVDLTELDTLDLGGNGCLTTYQPWLPPTADYELTSFIYSLTRTWNDGCEPTFTVTSSVDDVDTNVGDGICSAGASGCTLRAAIQEANAAPNPASGQHLIRVNSGVNPELTLAGQDDTGLAGDLDIHVPLTITGSVNINESTIQSNVDDRVIDHHGGLLVLEGVRIEGGESPNRGDFQYAYHYGAGIRSNADLILTNARLADNVASSYCSGDPFDDVNYHCEYSWGGGLYSTANASIIRSSVSGNKSGNGGGVYMAGPTSTLTVIVSDFSENEEYFVDISFGGPYLYWDPGSAIDAKGTVRIRNSSFVDNNAEPAVVGNPVIWE